MGNYLLFSGLFRKYRLRSEFETLTDFADGLAAEGYYYDESLFSHWQKGNRIPKNRDLVLALCRLFLNREAMTSLDQVNEFLSSAGQGYLTEDEIQTMPVQFPDLIPFVVPHDTSNFTGRIEDVSLLKRLLLNYEIVGLYGAHGIGKTSLALHLAHQLRPHFPDGVFWFRVDNSRPEHILTSITYAYGRGVSAHLPLKRMMHYFRSLVWNKQALYIYDNVDEETDLASILPNAPHSAVLCTSISPTIPAIPSAQMYHLGAFKSNEPFELIEKILGITFVEKHRSELQELVNLVYGLPLAVSILSRQIAFHKVTVSQMITKLKKQSIPLSQLTYEQTDLASALQITYEKLSPASQEVLHAASVYEGTDVSCESIDAVSQYHMLGDEVPHNQKGVSTILTHLVNQGFLETASHDRYRFHPFIKAFLRARQPITPRVAQATAYYTDFIISSVKRPGFFKRITDEVDSILPLLQATIVERDLIAAYALWKPFREYYWHVCYWKTFQERALQLYELAKLQGNKRIQGDLCLIDLSRIWYYDADMKKALAYSQEAFMLAEEVEDYYLQAVSWQRSGKIQLMMGDIADGYKNLKRSEAYFVRHSHAMQLSHTYRYIAEAHLLRSELDKVHVMLERSQSFLDRVESSAELSVYQAVLRAHIGILFLVEGDSEKAIIAFKEGLHIARNRPMIKGTYTWLNNVGLGLAYKKQNLSDRADKYLTIGVSQMQQMNIVDSYYTINAFAAALRPLLNESGYL
ncbi:MAG: NB-ARC domain-containing protein [Patescibacteria group bacterium]